MMRFLRLPILTCLLAVLLLPAAALAQSGKISGTVTEAATGEPLPGVNVAIVGTTQGAVSDVDGFYTILNVRPGEYDVRASSVGWRAATQEGVVVNIDLTTTVNFEMQEETVGMDELVVQAEQPIVQPDVSANVANITPESISNIPVAGVDEVINLQAGIEPGMSIRGSGMDEMSFMVDGMSTRNGRTNAPFTTISLTAVDAVQVQTGGFNAEYGNVRSGLVNVVTKQGGVDRYSADVLVRYGAPGEDYFGDVPNGMNGYYTRAFVDPEVSMEGTDEWDPYIRRQYREFEGWTSLSERLNNDSDPDNDLTPQQAREVFDWQFRKPLEVSDPRYTIDGSIGGPVPVISQALGNLRFHASYRQEQDPYVIPQRRSTYDEQMGRLKLTSDIAPGITLNLNGMYGQGLGLTGSSGGSGYDAEVPPYPWSTRGLVDNLNINSLYALDALFLQDVTWSMYGAELTHVLSPQTFYEVKLQRTGTEYLTRPGPERSTEIIHQVGSFGLTEYPYGWEFDPRNENLTDLTVRTVHHTYDSSSTAIWSGRFDITNQITQNTQLKAGAELINTQYNVNHGTLTSGLFIDQPLYRWNENPWQGAAYAQSKFEFLGLIANVGLRLDYFDAGDSWYSYDPYTRALSRRIGFQEELFDELEDIEETSLDPQVTLSPRLGVSFPITTDSKLFFNYGHFRQVLQPTSLYQIGRRPDFTVETIGNPEHPMPRTIAYELGFEQNLFNTLLLRMTGYYKDNARQPRDVAYISLDGLVNYERPEPYNYSDTRGFELSLSKNRGDWIRGFANYTYMVRKEGNFGVERLNENVFQQRQYELATTAHYQSRPVPEPFARLNLEFFTPRNYGPDVLGGNLLGGWHLNFLGEWRMGEAFTWTAGQNIRELENNVRWTDFWNLDLRISKDINAANVGRISLFADVANVLNLRHLSQTAPFVGEQDYDFYMESLHLPLDVFDEAEDYPYPFIPGDDRPGDYRKEGAPFVPIEIVASTDAVTEPFERPLYFVSEDPHSGQGTYMQWRDGAWVEADESFVDTVLDEKRYIDMPNESAFRFFNPRRVLFGVRVTF